MGSASREVGQNPGPRKAAARILLECFLDSYSAFSSFAYFKP